MKNGGRDSTGIERIAQHFAEGGGAVSGGGCMEAGKDTLTSHKISAKKLYDHSLLHITPPKDSLRSFDAFFRPLGRGMRETYDRGQ